MPKLERLPEEHMYQAYGLTLIRSPHRVIRRLKKRYQPGVHGHQAWSSSFLLMDYLIAKPVAKGAKVLEIGCGWGPAAIFCASRFKAKATGLDMDRDVFPFLEVLAELNSVQVKHQVGKFEGLRIKQLQGYHSIIGSDICFWDSLVKPLHHLVGRAMKAGVRRFVIADPGRPTFYEFADLCARKHRVQLVEWYAVEPERFEGEVVEIRSR